MRLCLGQPAALHENRPIFALTVHAGHVTESRLRPSLGHKDYWDLGVHMSTSVTLHPVCRCDVETHWLLQA